MSKRKLIILDNPTLEQLIKAMFPAPNWGPVKKVKVENATSTTPTKPTVNNNNDERE